MKDKDGVPQAQRPRKRPGRAPVSCAECRRLKMRCDRRHPCENCTKRGCAAICPDGTLTTGKYNRMILANTEELHDQIDSLLDRIRLLEDALRILQASVSTHPHPLLASSVLDVPPATLAPSTQAPAVLSIRDPVEGIGNPSSLEKEEERELIDTLGTLSIGLNGEAEFHGSTARIDYLLQDSDSDDGVELGRLPREFYGHTWPEAPPPTIMDEECVLGFLPHRNDAYELAEIYLEYGNWIGLFVSRAQLLDDLLAHVYHLPGHPWEHTVYTDPHRLALLLAIFAIGALLDPKREPYNSDADDYYHLARVALSFKSPVLDTTANAILAIMHIAFYLEYCDLPHGHMQAWVILGVAAKLSYSMGLHRDSSRWRLDDEVSQRRHFTFWQLYTMETMTSIQFGRPPLLSEPFIDCPLPRDGHSDYEEVDAQFSYHNWMIRFSRLARRISEEAFGAKTPSYSAMLTLDHQVREFGEPDLSSNQPSGPEDYVVSMQRMQKWCVMQMKETMLLHLHRGFLAKALSDSPQDTLGSKYGVSVNACFQSAYKIIQELNIVYEQLPDAVSRIGSWFASAVSSAIVMCLIVTRCPSTDLASPAMQSLNVVCDILRKVSGKNRTATRNLEAIKRLRRQAAKVLDQVRVSGNHALLPRDSELDEELDRLGGKTQLVSRRSRTPTSSYRSSLSPDRMDDGWGNQPAISSIAGWPGHGSQPKDSARAPYGRCSKTSGNTDFGGDGFYPPYGQGLDSTWGPFIEQLGF